MRVVSLTVGQRRVRVRVRARVRDRVRVRVVAPAAEYAGGQLARGPEEG
jgi:hypothetical protein